MENQFYYCIAHKNNIILKLRSKLKHWLQELLILVRIKAAYAFPTPNIEQFSTFFSTAARHPSHSARLNNKI